LGPQLPEGLDLREAQRALYLVRRMLRGHRGAGSDSSSSSDEDSSSGGEGSSSSSGGGGGGGGGRDGDGAQPGGSDDDQFEGVEASSVSDGGLGDWDFGYARLGEDAASDARALDAELARRAEARGVPAARRLAAAGQQDWLRARVGGGVSGRSGEGLATAP
jgi:hypothetical protein